MIPIPKIYDTEKEEWVELMAKPIPEEVIKIMEEAYPNIFKSQTETVSTFSPDDESKSESETINDSESLNESESIAVSESTSESENTSESEII